MVEREHWRQDKEEKMGGQERMEGPGQEIIKVVESRTRRRGTVREQIDRCFERTERKQFNLSSEPLPHASTT